MKIRPLHDRVVVRRADEETTTPGGIVIPDSASKEKPIQGEVVAVGPGKTLENGQKQAMSIKVGDKVLFGKYAGTEVKLNHTEYTVMREDDILCIVE